MDKLNLAAYLDSAGREIQGRIDKARFYQHPTGIGDAREDVVRSYLRESLPNRFTVERGKIIDSEGRLSREFDVIIAEASHVAPTLTLIGRRILPVESVYGVIEIKSKLNQKEFSSFVKSVVQLDQMKRYYSPVHHSLPNEKLERLKQGFDVQDNSIGCIWSGFIAFEAPRGKTIAKYLSKFCEGFWFLCVPGKELVTIWSDPPGFLGIPYKEKSLPLLTWLITTTVVANTRPNTLFPDFSRYRSNIIKATGDMKKSWHSTFRERPKRWPSSDGDIRNR